MTAAGVRCEQQHLVERYLLRTLSDEEAEEFERHFFSCQQCAEEVELGLALLDAGRKRDREPDP